MGSIRDEIDRACHRAAKYKNIPVRYYNIYFYVSDDSPVPDLHVINNPHEHMLDLLKMFDFQDFDADIDGEFELPEGFLKRNYRAWDQLQLLDSVPEDCRETVAYNLGMMAQYLMHGTPKTSCYGLPLDTIIFPIIVRSCRTEKITNPSKFWEHLLTWIDEHYDWFEKLQKTRPDPEADLAAVFSDHIREVLAKG